GDQRDRSGDLPRAGTPGNAIPSMWLGPTALASGHLLPTAGTRSNRNVFRGAVFYSCGRSVLRATAPARNRATATPCALDLSVFPNSAAAPNHKRQANR